jgi:hypothetical protein
MTLITIINVITIITILTIINIPTIITIKSTKAIITIKTIISSSTNNYQYATAIFKTGLNWSCYNKCRS